MQFTRSQLEAIQHHDGQLQLIACAGSGKTEVVAQRVANLLDPATGLDLIPGNIIAFTFTEKAAAELKERIIDRCRDRLGEIHGMAEMYVGTIHGFCLNLLKSEVPRFMKYGVHNEVQQALFIDRNSAKSGLTQCTGLDGQALRRYTDTSRYISALSILREADLNSPALTACSLLGGLTAYEALLERHRYLDYSSIMSETVRVLEQDAALRERLAGRVRQVIVDEYQDVNPIQERLVRILHELGASVCVVGDDDQTIYQWRGSAIENILTFATRYPNVTQVRLEENFRSSPGVVETAREFIAQNDSRLPKAMIATDAQAYEDGDITALAFDDPDSEARHIVATIQELRGVAFTDPDGTRRGLSYADMAVLYRSVKKSAEPLTAALRAAEIPYVVVGMNNLFDTPEAEAGRQLFYFMVPGLGVSEEDLFNAWQAANLGLRPSALRGAIRRAAAARDAMASQSGEERWSVYNIQRQYQAFIEEAGLREGDVPGGRGEVAFYNLGKFSQVISDFEAIHFHSEPMRKYEEFAGFLQYRAEDSYPEGWQDHTYASPDAVRIMTIHQAKGMQWPVVFVPGLIANRFPMRRPGGRTVWHLLPKAGVRDQARYEGGLEDERRLFYVATTRSQKFLFMSYGPIQSNQQARRVSDFWQFVLRSKYVKRRHVGFAGRERLEPKARGSVSNVRFSFSDLKYFFECPYQFKLRILYGFNPPIHEALGYGKSLHDALAEVHAAAIRGELSSAADPARLVETHLHVPYAYPGLREKLAASATRVVGDYIADNAADFDAIEFSEKEIELHLGDGVSVGGRIDLVRRLDTGATYIVDLKSNDRAQPEAVTETQLHIYALGYKELTGRDADYVEIYNLDERQKNPRSVDEGFIDEVRIKVRAAAEDLRANRLAAKPRGASCGSCDFAGLCADKAANK